MNYSKMTIWLWPTRLPFGYNIYLLFSRLNKCVYFWEDMSLFLPPLCSTDLPHACTKNMTKRVHLYKSIYFILYLSAYVGIWFWFGDCLTSSSYSTKCNQEQRQFSACGALLVVDFNINIWFQSGLILNL